MDNDGLVVLLPEEVCGALVDGIPVFIQHQIDLSVECRRLCSISYRSVGWLRVGQRYNGVMLPYHGDFHAQLRTGCAVPS